jgi:hypothetical protein
LRFPEKSFSTATPVLASYHKTRKRESAIIRPMSNRNKGTGRVPALLTLIGVLLALWLYVMGFSLVGSVKGLTYSKTKLQTRNPTSYVFHVPVKQIRSVLAHWGPDEPCTSPLLIGYPAPLHGEFEVVIMIEGVTEEMHGSD